MSTLLHFSIGFTILIFIAAIISSSSMLAGAVEGEEPWLFHLLVYEIYKDSKGLPIGAWAFLPLFIVGAPLYFLLYYTILLVGKFFKEQFPWKGEIK